MTTEEKKEKEDLECKCSDVIVQVRSGLENEYTANFRKLEKEINKCTVTITEEIKNLSVKIEEIPKLKQEMKNLQVNVKNKIQLFSSRQIDYEVKVSELKKRVELLEKENKTLTLQQVDRLRSYTHSGKENKMVLDNKIAELKSNLAALQQDNKRMKQNFFKVTNEFKNDTYKLEADFTSMIKEIDQIKKSSESISSSDRDKPYMPIPSPEWGSVKVPEMEKKILSQS